MNKNLLCKIFLFLLVFVACFGIFKISSYTTHSGAAPQIYLSVNCNITNDLQDVVEEQLGSLEEENFDKILNDLNKQQQNIFGDVGFTEKIEQLIAGTGQVSFADIVSFIASVLLDNLAGIIPVLAMICGIAIVGSVMLQIRGKNLNKPLGDIIHFACFAVVVVLVLTSVFQLVQLTSQTLNQLKTQMEVAFPLLLTVMAGLGAGTSVAIYQPIVAVLCGAMMQLFLNIVLPIFSLNVIFGVVGNMSSSVKLSKLTDFFGSLFKYIIGFAFTIFGGVLAVSGITAGSYDGVSIRATKYAIKSYIPFVGGYLTDGFSLIMASSVLIKNAIGYSGLIVMFLTIASPLIKIFLFKLGLNLVAGIIEPVADERITKFVSQTSKSLNMLSGIILAFSFAYLICVGLMMCTANVV